MERNSYGLLFAVFALVICLMTAWTGAEIPGDSANESATYTITATAGPNGSIEPSGIVDVPAGGNQSFTATPDPGHVNCWGAGTRYVVWNFTVDGQPFDIGGPSLQPVTYNFTDVQENHTLQANFETMFITARPTIVFDASPRNGFAPLPVNFTQVEVSTHDSVLWEFGDNETSTEENPEHTYFSAGNYTVSLTIYCDDDSFTNTSENYISVSELNIGGDHGYYLVHCNVDGARVYFGDNYVGKYRERDPSCPGLPDLHPVLRIQCGEARTISRSPPQSPIDRGKDETVDLYADLVPVETFEVPLGDGWNLLSTPFETQWEESTLDTILDIEGQPQNHIGARVERVLVHPLRIGHALSARCSLRESGRVGHRISLALHGNYLPALAGAYRGVESYRVFAIL